MNEKLRFSREVQVDDVVNERNVNATCRNISCDEQVHFLGTELGHVDLTSGLCEKEVWFGREIVEAEKFSKCYASWLTWKVISHN
jgi:hypothetical protein